MASCLTCRNARKVKTSCVGEAWCMASGTSVAVSHVCLCWVGLEVNAYLPASGLPDGLRGVSHHVQVNSGVKSHFETEIEESRLGFGGRF